MATRRASATRRSIACRWPTGSRSTGSTSPAMRWYADYACRDDYGALARDTSAWAGVHYFASRADENRGRSRGRRAMAGSPSGCIAMLARPHSHRRAGRTHRARQAKGMARARRAKAYVSRRHRDLRGADVPRAVRRRGSSRAVGVARLFALARGEPHARSLAARARRAAPVRGTTSSTIRRHWATSSRRISRCARASERAVWTYYWSLADQRASRRAREAARAHVARLGGAHPARISRGRTRTFASACRAWTSCDSATRWCARRSGFLAATAMRPALGTTRVHLANSDLSGLSLVRGGAVPRRQRGAGGSWAVGRQQQLLYRRDAERETQRTAHGLASAAQPAVIFCESRSGGHSSVGQTYQNVVRPPSGFTKKIPARAERTDSGVRGISLRPCVSALKQLSFIRGFHDPRHRVEFLPLGRNGKIRVRSDVPGTSGS